MIKQHKTGKNKKNNDTNKFSEEMEKKSNEALPSED